MFLDAPSKASALVPLPEAFHGVDVDTKCTAERVPSAGVEVDTTEARSEPHDHPSFSDFFLCLPEPRPYPRQARHDPPNIFFAVARVLFAWS
mmetsp:Transcript_24856/g.63412  ORF Transcript_24856/g.63412 Transcript_24856/m.63412 type:complete len:92 (-) Transcript_24856:285-560(-)